MKHGAGNGSIYTVFKMILGFVAYLLTRWLLEEYVRWLYGGILGDALERELSDYFRHLWFTCILLISLYVLWVILARFNGALRSWIEGHAFLSALLVFLLGSIFMAIFWAVGLFSPQTQAGILTIPEVWLFLLVHLAVIMLGCPGNIEDVIFFYSYKAGGKFGIFLVLVAVGIVFEAIVHGVFGV